MGRLRAHPWHPVCNPFGAMKKIAFNALIVLALAACNVSKKEEQNLVNGVDAGDYYRQFMTSSENRCRNGQTSYSVNSLHTAPGYSPEMDVILKTDGTFQLMAETSEGSGAKMNGVWRAAGTDLVLKEKIRVSGLDYNDVAAVTAAFPDDPSIPEFLRGEAVILVKGTARVPCPSPRNTRNNRVNTAPSDRDERPTADANSND